MDGVRRPIHCYMAFLENQPLSSALEARALNNATRYWRKFPAGWSYDNPYVCGKPWTSRIAEAVLIHLTASAQLPSPLPEEQVEAKIAGVGELKSVRLLTQLSAGGSLHDYYAGPGRSFVRFVAPSQEQLDAPTGGGATIASAWGANHSLIPARFAPSTDRTGFWVVHTSAKGGEAFISLPDELVIQAEWLAEPGGREAAVERAVAVEKPHRPIHVWFGGGDAAWGPGQTTWRRSDNAADAVKGSWINLDDAIGYVAMSSASDEGRSVGLARSDKAKPVEAASRAGWADESIRGPVHLPRPGSPGHRPRQNRSRSPGSAGSWKSGLVS